MKNILFIAICFVSLKLSAQGNLQFNQVVNPVISGQWTSNETFFGTITVPANKVWKIESASLMYSNNGGPIVSSAHASGLHARIGFNRIHSNQLEFQSSTFPIWLSEGTYDCVLVAGWSTNYQIHLGVSAIEFNVVP